jgi:hypothetical protein
MRSALGNQRRWYQNEGRMDLNLFKEENRTRSPVPLPVKKNDMPNAITGISSKKYMG